MKKIILVSFIACSFFAQAVASAADEALLAAARMGDVVRVQEALEHGANVNVAGSRGYTALMEAIMGRWPAVVELLLECEHIDVNARNEQGYTALMEAAKYSTAAIVKLLLKDERVDVNASDRSGSIALILAVEHGSLEILELLLQDKRTCVHHVSICGGNALIIAARSGFSREVELLLKDGRIDVNAQDGWGLTALMYAARRGHNDVANLLLQDKRTNVNAVEVEGCTALDLAESAAVEQCGEIVLELVKRALAEKISDKDAADFAWKATPEEEDDFETYRRLYVSKFVRVLTLLVAHGARHGHDLH